MSNATMEEPTKIHENGTLPKRVKIDSLEEEHKARLAEIVALVNETKPVKMALSDLTVLDYVQPRKDIDSRAVGDFQKVMLDAAEGQDDMKRKADALMNAFDPIVAFELEIGTKKEIKTVLVSGHTRKEALKRSFSEIDPNHELFAHASARVKVLKGRTMTEAIDYAVWANKDFVGSRMRSDDYRKAVKNILTLDPTLSARAIAIRINKALSHPTIQRLKEKLLEAEEVPENKTAFQTTASGKVMKKKAQTPRKQGFRQKNGKPFPVHLEEAVADATIAKFVDSIRQFVKEATGKNKALHHIPPKVLTDLQFAEEALLESRPGNACDLCVGDGCANCNTTGFVPIRDCYPSPDAK